MINIYRWDYPKPQKIILLSKVRSPNTYAHVAVRNQPGEYLWFLCFDGDLVPEDLDMQIDDTRDLDGNYFLSTGFNTPHEGDSYLNELLMALDIVQRYKFKCNYGHLFEMAATELLLELSKLND